MVADRHDPRQADMIRRLHQALLQHASTFSADWISVVLQSGMLQALLMSLEVTSRKSMQALLRRCNCQPYSVLYEKMDWAPLSAEQQTPQEAAGEALGA